MESVRQSKIARLVQKELARYFQAESRSLLPGKMITVTIVRVTPDLGLAKVYLSIFPKEQNENNLEVVSRQTKTIRTALGNSIRHQVRIIPELAFYLDDSMDYVERIDRLLKS
jgi:ribosome-binding factor A